MHTTFFFEISRPTQSWFVYYKFDNRIMRRYCWGLFAWGWIKIPFEKFGASEYRWSKSTVTKGFTLIKRMGATEEFIQQLRSGLRPTPIGIGFTLPQMKEIMSILSKKNKDINYFLNEIMHRYAPLQEVSYTEFKKIVQNWIDDD